MAATYQNETPEERKRRLVRERVRRHRANKRMGKPGRPKGSGKKAKQETQGPKDPTVARLQAMAAGEEPPPRPPRPEIAGTDGTTDAELQVLWDIGTSSPSDQARVAAIRAHHEIAQEHARQPAANELRDELGGFFDAMKDGAGADDPEPSAA